MKKPKESIANIKRMVNQVMMPGIDEYLALEKECMMQCGETANFAEGVSAFIEKRKPSFNQK